jgi:large repetitive protein
MSGISPPAHGSVVCPFSGVCTYTPNAGYFGPDVFWYTITDGQGGFDSAVVNVTVTPAGNQPPVADDETLTTPEDTAGNVNVLVGDTDANPTDTLMVTSASPSAAHGTVSCTTAGLCTYTPAANYHGPDGFDYTVSDGQGGTDTGHVTITVTTVNDPPVADDETLTTDEDTPGSVDVLIGDTDIDGGVLVVWGSTSPLHGSLACTEGGVCSYTPNPNYNGPDGFDYTVNDGADGFDTAHVTITVTPVNDNPDAVNDSLTTTAGTAKDVNVLANDTDVDGDPRTVTTAAPTAAHGSVFCTAAGVCTYTPNPGYLGSDSFTYSISDGHGGTDTATVNVTVSPANLPPNAVDDSFTTPQDTALSVNVFGNDSDDGAFQLSSYTQPAHGSAHCTIAGDCTYTPAAGYVGPDSFTYTIADGLAEDTATVTIMVTGSNTAPSCANVKPSKAKLWPPRHKFIVITLSGATDGDGDPLTWSITKVTQDEKTAKAISKSDKGPDAQRVSGKASQVKLKAERVASGNGRVYRIFYTVTDGRGGKCTGVEKVGVPRTKNGTAIDNTAKRYNSFN